MHQHLSETSQQRADRLLADYQQVRNRRRAKRMRLELSGDPLPDPTRWQRFKSAARPWLVGFDNPFMDALAVAFGLCIAATLTIFAAMLIADHAAPPASTIPPVEATPSPVAENPLLGGGANGAVR